MLNWKLQFKLIAACLLCELPLLSSAGELPQNEASPFCSYRVFNAAVTPYSVVTFTSAPTGGGRVRWICVDGKLLLAAGHTDGENAFGLHDLDEDFLSKDGEWVERLGRPIVLRMVVNEDKRL
jgi:hypothetical protein